MIPQDALVDAGRAMAATSPGWAFLRILLVLTAMVVTVTCLRILRHALVAWLRPLLGPAWRVFQNAALILNYFVGLASFIHAALAEAGIGMPSLPQTLVQLKAGGGN